MAHYPRPWLKHWIDVNLLLWIRLEECITSDVREVHTLDVEHVMEITAPPKTRLDFAKQVADPLWAQCQLFIHAVSCGAQLSCCLSPTQGATCKI